MVKVATSDNACKGGHPLHAQPIGHEGAGGACRLLSQGVAKTLELPAWGEGDQ